MAQVLHFGTDREAVAKGAATQVKLKSQTEDAYVALDLKLPKLECATTYYWRIEPVLEGGQISAIPPWSFTTSGFELEFDGRVSEPFPDNLQQDGFYSRWMDIGGYPVISPPGNDDIHPLAWDQTTWDALDGNRSWSVDDWVRRDNPPTGEETLVEWGSAGTAAARLLWGAADDSFRFSNGMAGKWKHHPEPQIWNHLVWVFTGGGLSDDDGELRVYQNGRLDHTVRIKLALPTESRVAVGRGFTGALAHLRIYNYDLHPLQIAALYERESPPYRRVAPPAADRLLVDLDPGILAPVADPDCQPFYPPGLNQPWLRSWVNLGTLAARFHNDARAPRTSRPRAGAAHGAPAISFDGKSRMISGFAVPLPPTATVELWAFAENDAPEGVILQWGPLAVSSRLLKPGAWQHLALTLDRGNLTSFVNGVQVSSGRLYGSPGVADRLILGAAGDGANLTKGFRGHLGAVRIHDLTLTSTRIQQHMRWSSLCQAMLPDPAVDERVVVSRKPALARQCATGIAGKTGDIYLGTGAEEVANAKQGAPCHLGRHSPGECRPPLQPSTEYFWRVDVPGPDGKVLSTGPVWSFRTAAGMVMVLDAADLPAGPVKAWRIKGSAGGEFIPGTERELWRPVVILRDGLKGVDFSGRKSLVSSFVAPPDLTGSKSFTVAVWGYCPDQRVLEREQTMLSWGRRPRDRAEFSWGSNDKNGAFSGGANISFGFAAPGNALLPGAWRHLAYVYDAAAGKLRIHIDGRLNREEDVKLAVPAGEVISASVPPATAAVTCARVSSPADHRPAMSAGWMSLR